MAVLKKLRKKLKAAVSTKPNVRLSEVSLCEERDRLFSSLKRELGRGGIEYFTGGATSEQRVRLNVKIEDAAKFFEILLTIAEKYSAYYRAPDLLPRPIDGVLQKYRKKGFRFFDIRVVERRIALPDEILEYFSALEIDFWAPQEASYKDQKYIETKRRNRVCSKLRKDTANRLFSARCADSGAPFDIDCWEEAKDLHKHGFDIDIVYTWVNDRDEEWLDKLQYYKKNARARSSAEGRRFHKERFSNRDELRYSLRSVELFAPFVRKIFIVTANQVPDWLFTDHPNIEMVSHEQIYADTSALPVFNSSSIETQLHHIEGLAEHFLYFNDDFFLGQICRPNDFFLANGSMKFFPTDHTISANDIDNDSEEFIVADKNAIQLFKDEFGFTVHFTMRHAPYVARRSSLYDLERLFQDSFDNCQKQRFRSKHDLRPIAFMLPHYGFYRGIAVPAAISNRYLALWKPLISAQLDSVLKKRSYKTFCINDVGLQASREERINREVAKFLESYFPIKSSFEK